LKVIVIIGKCWVRVKLVSTNIGWMVLTKLKKEDKRKIYRERKREIVGE
jgi:hypothetical protein